MMTWTYRCYRFPGEEAFLAACDRLIWPRREDGQPMPPDGALAITGALTPANGEPEGWYVMLGSRGSVPESWEAYLLPSPHPDMTVIAGWSDVAPIGPLVTKTQLMDLLTPEEQVALVTDASLAVAWWRFRALAQETAIDLNNPRTGAGLEVLANAGILEAGRITRILAGLPPA